MKISTIEIQRYFNQHAEKPDQIINLFVEMADAFGSVEVISWLSGQLESKDE